VLGALEVTQIEYPDLLDMSSLSPQMLAVVQNSLMAGILQPQGRKFRPSSSVSRFELAEALVRSGLVPQYVAAAPIFQDVRDPYTRSSVESVQSNPGGKLIYDADAGGRFYPYQAATKLAVAIALVRAANLEGAASSATLPSTVIDASSIPAQWRGHVAVALQNGYISLDGDQFNGTRAITRVELAAALQNIL